MSDEYDYLEQLTFRVNLGRDGSYWRMKNAEKVETLIAEGWLVQVVPKQRTAKGLHTIVNWVGKKIGIR
jgi:hypothetical protein